MLLPLLLAQASVVPSDDAGRVVIDLLVPAPCADDEVQRLQGEIVVCANRHGDGDDRLADAPDGETGTLPRAQVELADGSVVSAETESADLGMARSQRLMVRLKIPF